MDWKLEKVANLFETGEAQIVEFCRRIEPVEVRHAVVDVEVGSKAAEHGVASLEGATGVNAGTAPTAKFNEPMNASTITTSTFQLRDANNSVVPATVSYNAATKTATLTPQSALQYGATYTATVKGGAGRRHGRRRQRRSPPTSSWSFTTEASPPQMLVVDVDGEAVRLLPRRDPPQRGPERVHDDRRRLPLAGAAERVRRRRARRDAAERGAGVDAHRLGQRRRQPDRDAAGQAAGRPARAHRRERHALRTPTSRSTTSMPPGAGIVGSTIQYHGTADRYTLNGATAVATLYSNATTATTNPAVTLRSVGSSGGQAAAFTYDLARSVVYTRQGNPAWAGQERDGVVGHPPRRHVLLDAGSNTNKIAIPQADEQQRLLAQPDHADERRQDAAAALLVPAARREGGRRDERRRPLAGQAPGGTASHFDRFKALSPAGCVVAEWECVRSTLVHLSRTASLTNAQAAAYVADGFEVGAPPGRRVVPDDADDRRRSSSTFFDTQLGAFAGQVHEHPGARLEPHPLRLLARLGVERRRSSSRTGSGWTPTTTTTPAPGSAPSPAS